MGEIIGLPFFIIYCEINKRGIHTKKILNGQLIMIRTEYQTTPNVCESRIKNL